MPLSGQYYFAFSVMRSLQNNIQIGVAPLSYYPRFDDNDNDDDKEWYRQEVGEEPDPGGWSFSTQYKSDYSA